MSHSSLSPGPRLRCKASAKGSLIVSTESLCTIYTLFAPLLVLDFLSIFLWLDGPPDVTVLILRARYWWLGMLCAPPVPGEDLGAAWGQWHVVRRRWGQNGLEQPALLLWATAATARHYIQQSIRNSLISFSANKNSLNPLTPVVANVQHTFSL